MNSIYMYDIAANGSSTLLSINLSPTDGDGPRNTYPSKDGRLLYVVRFLLRESINLNMSLI